MAEASDGHGLSPRQAQIEINFLAGQSIGLPVSTLTETGGFVLIPGIMDESLELAV